MFVQIVKFKLRPNASREAFVDVTEQMIVWLKNRKGFVAYELYEGAEYWSDRIAWDDQQCAQDGLRDFQATSVAQKLIRLVDDDYSSFFGQIVAFAQHEQNGSTLRSGEAA